MTVWISAMGAPGGQRLTGCGAQAVEEQPQVAAVEVGVLRVRSGTA